MTPYDQVQVFDPERYALGIPMSSCGFRPAPRRRSGWGRRSVRS
jgi:hypothetical protein